MGMHPDPRTQTRTFTTTLVALLASAACAHAASIDVGSASGAPGTTVTIDVTLNTMGQQVGGTTNDVAFDLATPITACRVNPEFAILSGVSFQPQGCTVGVDCAGLRAVIIEPNLLPIRNGSVLYSCDIKIAANAGAGSYPLACSSPSASSPGGGSVTAECSDGEVSVPPQGDGGGSCRIVPVSNGGWGIWLVFLPAVIVMRRCWRFAGRL
jgi:hypothetical protein